MVLCTEPRVQSSSSSSSSNSDEMNAICTVHAATSKMKCGVNSTGNQGLENHSHLTPSPNPMHILHRSYTEQVICQVKLAA